MPGAEDEGCAVLYYDTLLRYYMHVDPWTLGDEEWAWTLRYLIDIRKTESKAYGQRT